MNQYSSHSSGDPQGIPEPLTPFRRIAGQRPECSRIGDGSIGGKASGLVAMRETLAERFPSGTPRGIRVGIPPFTVITTDFFDRFMEMNDLYPIALSGDPDDRIAHHFLKGGMPPDLIGDLRHLITHTHTPLAIRSSGLLEDAADSPFAGIYETKMIPNNQPDTDSRFSHLVNAIKFVYASTFFAAARSYREAVGSGPRDEKMAVIIQDVAGRTRNKRHYPIVSGVARSVNFYPHGNARPEEGVVDMALGLGKSIVDGGRAWSYSPAQPRAVPPFGSTSDWLKETQRKFWAVHMGKTLASNPLRETEFMIHLELEDADYDNTLRRVASTYDAASDCIRIGVSQPGPRIITFGPILQAGIMPLNQLILDVLDLCESTTGARVEMEFAVDWGGEKEALTEFSLLQVRPMALSEETVSISDTEFSADHRLLATASAMGNGITEAIHDIVYLKRDTFDFKHSRRIAEQLAELNRDLLARGTPYLLIGFGRWGSSDPWLGIPVNWGQISGARAIVESTPAGAHVDLSQGSHFFHNLTSLKILYFSLKYGRDFLDWDWLDAGKPEHETEYLRHLRLQDPLTLKVDGRSRKGVILR